MSLGPYAVSYAEKIKRELETLRKKKQHLDGLLNSEKISKSTFDYLAKTLDDEIVKHESQQKTFADTLTSKLKEREEYFKDLELYLAEIELKHVASEIDADLYERESKLLTTGIETARRELNETRKALFEILPNLTLEEPVVEEVTPDIAEEKVEDVEEQAETSEDAEASTEELESTDESTEKEGESGKNPKWWGG